ncbi:MAG: hypothetical protein ABI797_03000 [Chloroflexota bacterium]
MDNMPGRFPPPDDAGPGWAPRPEGPPQGSGGWQAPTQRGFYPLDIGRVFGLTFSLFRFRWKTFVGVSLLVIVPVAAIQAFATTLSSPDMYSELAEIARGRSFDALARFFTAALAVSLVLGLIIGIATYIGTAAVTDLTVKVFGGVAANGVGSLKRALSRFVTLGVLYLFVFLATVVVVAVGVFVGMGLFLATATGGQIIPGPTVFLALIIFVATAVVLLFLVVRWTLAVQVAMVESAGAMTSLRRSWHLVAGSGWRVFGYILAFGLLVALIAGVIGAIVSLVLNPVRIIGLSTIEIDPTRYAIATFVSTIIAGVLVPIPTIATTLLYYDLRFRKSERMPEPGQGLPTDQPPLPTEQ